VALVHGVEASPWLATSAPFEAVARRSRSGPVTVRAVYGPSLARATTQNVPNPTRSGVDDRPSVGSDRSPTGPMTRWNGRSDPDGVASVVPRAGARERRRLSSSADRSPDRGPSPTAWSLALDLGRGPRRHAPSRSAPLDSSAEGESHRREERQGRGEARQVRLHDSCTSFDMSPRSRPATGRSSVEKIPGFASPPHGGFALDDWSIGGPFGH
jgi:hypothetical protein